MFSLRGHHFLCILGYRGMGYSKDYVRNMTQLHQTLCTAPDTEILIVDEPDDLCAKFPSNQPYHCEDHNIQERDQAILNKLGIHAGQILSWNTIQSLARKNFSVSDVPTLCSTCSWKAYGVCEEGVQEIIDGKNLRIIP